MEYPKGLPRDREGYDLILRIDNGKFGGAVFDATLGLRFKILENNVVVFTEKGDMPK